MPEPILCDRSEQTMFDRIPLRCTARIMTNRHRQAAFVTEFLQRFLPQPSTTAVTAARIGKITGRPALRKRVTSRRINRNCLSRSGCGGPDSRLTLLLRENLRNDNHLPTEECEMFLIFRARCHKLSRTSLRLPVGSPPECSATIFSKRLTVSILF